MISNWQLWRSLESFSIDDAATESPFTDRLARENKWSLAFTRKAVEEYKRFVYLAAVGKGEVTPSRVVDEVWHLHLTYTRSYWDDLCGRALKRPLHHNPTKGGANEDRRFEGQYAATLALYREEFGAAPPRAFWPKVEPAARMKRVDWRKAPTAAAALGASALLALGTGFADVAPDPSPSPDQGALVIGLVVAAVLAVIILSASRIWKRPDGRGGHGGCGSGSCGGTGGKGDGGGHGGSDHGSCGGGCGGGE